MFSYPSRFIDAQFKQFFSMNHTSTTNVLQLVVDEGEYLRMRQQLLTIPTIKETQVTKRAALAEPSDSKDNTIVDTVHNKSVVVKEKQWIDCLILHYTHEKRLESYKRDIHQIWERVFVNTPVMNVRVIVGHRNSQNIKRELVRKRPHASFLYAKEENSKH